MGQRSAVVELRHGPTGVELWVRADVRDSAVELRRLVHELFQDVRWRGDGNAAVVWPPPLDTGP